MRIQGLALVAVIAFAGCHASVSANVKASGSAEQESLDEGAPAPEPASAEPLVGEPDAEKPPTPTALLGARHDLRLAASVTTPTCTCLATAIGPPDNASFAWNNGVPTVDPDSQEVVAMSSQGVKCAAKIPKDTLGASYWGYRVENNNVIVFVENARFGRPITAGAIIPKPAPGGHVYIEPASKDVPFGRPLSGGGNRCQLQ